MTEPKPSEQYTTEAPRPVVTHYDFRHTCGRLLLRGYLPPDVYLTMRCPRCGGMAVFDTRKNGEKLPLDSKENLA